MIGTLIDTTAYIEYGILIALVLDATLLFLLATLNTGKTLNILSYIIAVALLGLLTFQMSRLIAACHVSRTVSAINNIVDAISPTIGQYVASASSLTTRDIGWFIFRRILWSVVFLGIGGAGIWVTMDKKHRGHRPPAGIQTGRRYTSHTSRRHR